MRTSTFGLADNSRAFVAGLYFQNALSSSSSCLKHLSKKFILMLSVLSLYMIMVGRSPRAYTTSSKVHRNRVASCCSCMSSRTGDHPSKLGSAKITLPPLDSPTKYMMFNTFPYTSRGSSNSTDGRLDRSFESGMLYFFKDWRTDMR